MDEGNKLKEFYSLNGIMVYGFNITESKYYILYNINEKPKIGLENPGKNRCYLNSIALLL